MRYLVYAYLGALHLYVLVVFSMCLQRLLYLSGELDRVEQHALLLFTT